MESFRRSLSPNPREMANIFSRLFSLWTVPLFLKGYRKDLGMDDIYQPLKADRSESLGERLERNWTDQTKSSKPSLIRAVLKTFWREYALLSTICGVNDIGIRLTQPLLLGQLLLYFREGSTMKYEEAIIYASGIVILTAINAILVSQFYSTSFHNGMKVRVAVCSLVYRKSLRLSHTALGEASPGKVVNLLSNDVRRFELASLFSNAMWTAPTLTVIVTVLLFMEIGWAALLGVGVICIVAPIQAYGGRLSTKFRLQTALRTDERVRLMDEIVSGVQAIKMYTWERPFSKLIANARKLELKIVRKNSHVRAVYLTLMMFTPRMAVFVTMLSIALLYGSNQLTVVKVFVLSSYFGVIAYSMCQVFVRGISEFAEALVSFRRIQNFLELDEKVADALHEANNGIGHGTHPNEKVLPSADIPKSENVAIALKRVTARWKLPVIRDPLQQGIGRRGRAGQDKNCELKEIHAATLDEMSADLVQGKLIGIVGAVGAGKSSLLQAILGELPIESGAITVNGTLSYASQEPWVFAGTIRQNILFGQEYDAKRYAAVVDACALPRDLTQLPHGDESVIGERGTSLSGGQKARVSLARAIYRRSDIYLLDDPLSAVDSHVGAHLFSKCIGPNGRLARLGGTRVLVTHQVHFLRHADWVLVLENGKISKQGKPADLVKEGVDFGSFEESEQLSTNEEIENCDDSPNTKENEKPKARTEGRQLEESSKTTIKSSIGKHYYRSGASRVTLTILLLTFLLCQVLASSADIWVSIWTKYEESKASNQHLHQIEVRSSPNNNTNEAPSFELTTKTCVYVHGTLVIGLFVTSLARSIGFYAVCVRASQKLHDGLFKGLISTKMRFFDTNPSGRVLNRVARDIGAVDELLPKAILDAAQVIFNMVGAIVVTVIVNPLFLAPVAVLSTIFVFIRQVYLRTSRDIKRLEGSAKSPSFTHLAATLNGLSTIRAFDAQQILTEEFDHHQDTHTACWFMFISTSFAFGLALDIMCTVFMFCIIYFYMVIDTGVSGEKIGLAITQTMSLTGILQFGIRQSADISNQMMSVERILEYRDLKPEPEPEKPRAVDEEWPAKGRIELQNVSYRYFVGATPVLHNLSLAIRAKEKVGIVGRTGAGKSSLVGAIFRMACVEGKVTIDDVDVSTITLRSLRSNIAIIPQDPVLFSGTLRRNLDPFEEYNDADIWSALEKAAVKEIAAGPFALNAAVMARGSNLSVGQRQLVCLARAILRRNRILVLDEATANVDPQMDVLVQRTIREQFADCTVLTIAHRLNTVVDSDRILVLDAGQAVEFDEAHELLQNEGGAFNEMVKALGPKEYNRLAQIALRKYNDTHAAKAS